MCRGRMRMTTFSESAPEALPSAWIISAVPRILDYARMPWRGHIVDDDRRTSGEAQLGRPATRRPFITTGLGGRIWRTFPLLRVASAGEASSGLSAGSQPEPVQGFPGTRIARLLRS